MKTTRATSAFATGLIALAILLFSTNVLMADGGSTRLAIIPFSAPQKNEVLQKAASQLPDLLMVELSSENYFQLVERDKVSAIWSELHLTEDGFVSAATAEKLGNMLSCDWLVGGSIVQIGTNTQVWIKVIDVHSGVVLDLKTFPYNPTDFSATVVPMPAFLKQVDPHSEPRKFIALGKFADQSLSSTRADWSQRLPALIEKHFLDAGYGVVERQAVAPIFSEFQFESAGLTGDYTNRVKLKPAFWIVDGGYKWVYDTEEKLSVALRVQKVGGDVQIFRFTVPPDELENNVVGSIESMITNTPSPESAQTATEESAAREAEAMKYAGGHDEFANGSVLATREDAINAFKQAILLNPNNWHARYMLGYALFQTVDPETVREGRDFLNETAASKDPTYSIMASNLLDDYAKGRLTVQALPWGGFQITPHGQPHSWPNYPASTSSPPATVQAQPSLANQVTNILPRADSALQISPPLSSGDYEWITAVKLYHGELFIACRTKLYKYDPVTESTVEINLPANLQHNINALEADDNNLWLGSGGDGLLQISRTGELIRQYDENDGFPSAAVSSLDMENGRLRIGFSNNDSGYIDLGPGKFTGHMSDIAIFDRGNGMLPPPSFPPAPGTNDDFMVSLAAISDEFMLNGCVALCRPHGTNWFMISLSTDFTDNTSYCSVVDQNQPGLLWIGNGNDKITFVDMNKLEVVGECRFDHGDTGVKWMLDDGDKMIVITMGNISETYNLYCIEKPSFSGDSLVANNGQATMSASVPSSSVTSVPASPGDGLWPFDYVQQNFSKLGPIQFKKGENGQAALQRFQVGKNMFMYQDENFFGLKFTTPPWLDGDVQFMYSVIKTEQNKFWASQGGEEGIIAADESIDAENCSFDDLTRYRVVDYPQLHELLPYTQNFSVQTIRLARLQPGKTYALWFDVEEKDYPDFLFAIAVNSPRGAAEYGTLPMVAGPPQPGPVTTDNPPRSAEELRSRFEAALKSKDEAAALSLVYWQGSDSPGLDDRCLPDEVYSADGIEAEIDRILAGRVGTVGLRPWSSFYGMTNVVNGVPYGPNITGVGEITVEAADRHWEEFLLYGKQGNGYYIPVGIKEPVSPAK